MSGVKEKYQEIDRGKVVRMGGTLYIKIPKAIERQDDIKEKDTIIYSKSPDSNKTVIEKLKKDDENES